MADHADAFRSLDAVERDGARTDALTAVITDDMNPAQRRVMRLILRGLADGAA